MMATDHETMRALGALQAKVEEGDKQRTALWEAVNDIPLRLDRAVDRIERTIREDISPLKERLCKVEREIAAARTALHVHKWYLGGLVAAASVFGPRVADALARKLGLQ